MRRLPSGDSPIRVDRRTAQSAPARMLAAVDKLRTAGADKLGSALRLARADKSRRQAGGPPNFYPRRRAARTDGLHARRPADARIDDLRSRRRTIWPMRRDEGLTRGRTAARMLLRRRLPTMVFVVLRRGQPG